MSIFDGEEVEFEETMADGTVRRGKMRLLTDLEALHAELTLLRGLAYAVDAFQVASKYVAGDFLTTYKVLEQWRKWKHGP